MSGTSEREVIAGQIGEMILRNSEAVHRIAQLEAGLLQAWRSLADCIRSGQVPDQDVPKIMADNPDFAEWYRAKFG